MSHVQDRRGFLTAGASLLVASCHEGVRARATAPAGLASSDPKPDDKAGDVGATEDLMREHGVIRRVLSVYRECAARLRVSGASVPPDALRSAATLFRTFGEEYHEKKLEEAHLFPAVARAGGPASSYVATLVAQHDRGRQITDYVLAVTQRPIGAGAAALASTLEGFARMYELHAAVEDTVVFPAWKAALTPKALDAMGDLFEDIEHASFGKDGFEDAVARIASIEASLGIALSSFTAPAPPNASP